MAKKFMFVCFGILALTIAFLLGAQFGQAEYVDHSQGGIVSVEFDGSYVYALLANGEVWYNVSGQNWFQETDCAPSPIPVSEIRFWTAINGLGATGYPGLVSNSNELWYCNPADGSWHNAGAPPMGQTRVESSTWGQIKAQFKD